jgi:hypothetical protein
VAFAGMCCAVLKEREVTGASPDPSSAHHGRFPSKRGGWGRGVNELSTCAHDNGCTPRCRATITTRTMIPQQASSDSDLELALDRYPCQRHRDRP